MFYMDREECAACLEREANLNPLVTRIGEYGILCNHYLIASLRHVYATDLPTKIAWIHQTLYDIC
jgi:hypothetical protein